MFTPPWSTTIPGNSSIQYTPPLSPDRNQNDSSPKRNIQAVKQRIQSTGNPILINKLNKLIEIESVWKQCRAISSQSRQHLYARYHQTEQQLRTITAQIHRMKEKQKSVEQEYNSKINQQWEELTSSLDSNVLPSQSFPQVSITTPVQHQNPSQTINQVNNPIPSDQFNQGSTSPDVFSTLQNSNVENNTFQHQYSNIENNNQNYHRMLINSSIAASFPPSQQLLEQAYQNNEIQTQITPFSFQTPNWSGMVTPSNLFQSTNIQQQQQRIDERLVDLERSQVDEVVSQSLTNGSNLSDTNEMDADEDESVILKDSGIDQIVDEMEQELVRDMEICEDVVEIKQEMNQVQSEEHLLRTSITTQNKLPTLEQPIPTKDEEIDLKVRSFDVDIHAPIHFIAPVHPKEPIIKESIKLIKYSSALPLPLPLPVIGHSKGHRFVIRLIIHSYDPKIKPKAKAWQQIEVVYAGNKEQTLQYYDLKTGERLADKRFDNLREAWLKISKSLNDQVVPDNDRATDDPTLLFRLDTSEENHAIFSNNLRTFDARHNFSLGHWFHTLTVAQQLAIKSKKAKPRFVVS